MSDILRRRTERELEAESRRSPGARLRWLRTQKGITLGDLARFLNCSVVEISAIEQGKSVSEGAEWINPP